MGKCQLPDPVPFDGEPNQMFLGLLKGAVLLLPESVPYLTQSRACYTGSPFSATFHRGGSRIPQFEPYDETIGRRSLQFDQPRQTEGRKKWGHGITRTRM
jgi:hypothetical protein